MLSFSFGEEKNPRLKMFSLRYFLILIVLAVFYVSLVIGTQIISFQLFFLLQTAAYSNPIVKDETTTEQSVSKDC